MKWKSVLSWGRGRLRGIITHYVVLALRGSSGSGSIVYTQHPTTAWLAAWLAGWPGETLKSQACCGLRRGRQKRGEKVEGTGRRRSLRTRYTHRHTKRAASSLEQFPEQATCPPVRAKNLREFRNGIRESCQLSGNGDDGQYSNGVDAGRCFPRKGAPARH